MKVWKRRVRRSRLEKPSLTSPPEALKWVDRSELAGNPRTWDVWLPEWCCEGIANGEIHESCHLRELLICAVAPWAAQSGHLSVSWAAGGWQSQQWRWWERRARTRCSSGGLSLTLSGWQPSKSNSVCFTSAFRFVHRFLFWPILPWNILWGDFLKI